MRVLVAGATGVIGRQLVPLLSEAGHEVIALARSRKRASAVQGVELVVADALDRSQLIAAVRDARPDAIVHLLTAIPGAVNPKKIDGQFELTNRLRTDATRSLLSAAKQVGDARLIVQSIAFAYDPSGDAVKSEDAPLWRQPPGPFAPVVAAVAEMERLVAAEDGVVLRFGHLYGPGSAMAPDGGLAEQVRKRQLPLVKGGASVFSFTHARDAAAAIRSALALDAGGTFNVVDDEPAPIRDWLPVYAETIGAKPPRSMPAMLVRMAAGPYGLAYLTELRGASNERAKQTMGWTPEFASWRAGFRAQASGADALAPQEA